jgi:hypothetical protein
MLRKGPCVAGLTLTRRYGKVTEAAPPERVGNHSGTQWPWPWLRFALPFATVLLSLAAIEILFRTVDSFTHFMDTYDLRRVVEIYSAHPSLSHTLKPGMDDLRPARGDVPAYRLRTNALGFRFDEARFRDKDPTTFRIAVLGDSLVEGFEEAFTLPRLLEKELAGVRITGRRIETMNWGVMSYSPLIHYVNLRRNVLKYAPDLVLLHFDLTDVFDDNVRYKDITRWDPEGNPESVGPVAFLSVNVDGRMVHILDYGAQLAATRPLYSPHRLRIWLLEHSPLFLFGYAKAHPPNTILEVYLKELEGTSVKVPLRKSPQVLEWAHADSPKIREQVAFSFGVLGKIHGLLAEHKIRLVVTTLPNRAQLVSIKGQPRWPLHSIERLQAFCQSRGVPFYSPAREFETALQEGASIYVSDNMHLANPGQEQWAAALARYLTKIHSL